MEAEWIKLFPITSSTVFMIPHYLIFSGERNPISSNSLLCDKILNLLHHPYHSFPRSASFPSCLPLNIKPLCVCMLSCVWLFATSWTVAHQAPLTMGFSRQEYWSWLPCPPPEDLPHSGIKFSCLTFPALGGRFFTTSTTWEAQI